jgi:hypothetical protein
MRKLAGFAPVAQHLRDPAENQGHTKCCPEELEASHQKEKETVRDALPRGLAKQKSPAHEQEQGRSFPEKLFPIATPTDCVDDHRHIKSRKQTTARALRFDELQVAQLRVAALYICKVHRLARNPGYCS